MEAESEAEPNASAPEEAVPTYTGPRLTEAALAAAAETLMAGPGEGGRVAALLRLAGGDDSPVRPGAVTEPGSSRVGPRPASRGAGDGAEEVGSLAEEGLDLGETTGSLVASVSAARDSLLSVKDLNMAATSVIKCCMCV